MKSHEKVYKRLLKLRKEKADLITLFPSLRVPAREMIQDTHDRVHHQIAILEWVMKDEK